MGYSTSSDHSCLAKRSLEWQACFSRERLQYLIFLLWSKAVSNLRSLWNCPQHGRGRAVMQLLLQVSQSPWPMLTHLLSSVKFCTGTCNHFYQYNIVSRWSIIVSKTDNKLHTNISQSWGTITHNCQFLFFPLPLPQFRDLWFQLLCLESYLFKYFKKIPKTVVCFVPSLVLLKLCSQSKINSLIPCAVLIKALTFLMLNFDWKGLSWLLHCPVAHSL